MKNVGIIGGMGPETTSEFYLKIIEACRKRNNIKYPSITIYSLPIPYKLERDVVERSRNEESYLPLLKEAIQVLQKAKVDFIVMPCNTMHLFIDDLRKSTKLPFFSIIEETVKNCVLNNYQTVGLLATPKTIQKELYQKEFERKNIKVILPSKDDQREISSIIFRILYSKQTGADKKKLQNVISQMQQEGIEAVILGCTDLPILLKRSDSPLPLLNTLEIFVDSTVKEILS